MVTNAKKSNEANEAALSAIEQALNIAAEEVAQSPRPIKAIPEDAPSPIGRPRKIAAASPLQDDIFADSAPTSSTANDDSFIMPNTAPANDERSDIGQLLYMLNRKPDTRPLWIASLLSILWGVFALISALNTNFMSNSVGLLQLIAVTVAPMAIAFACAFMFTRSQEMRLMAKGMSEVALRLAEPEHTARDTIATVGQAIRREVDYMNSGMANAVQSASSLEGMVKKEVLLLEASFRDNEMRMRELTNDMMAHRQSLVGQAVESQEAFRTTHLGLVSEMSDKTANLGELLKATQEIVLQRISAHTDEVTEQFAKAGTTVVDSLHLRSTDILDKLSLTGAEVAEKLENTHGTITTTLQTAGSAIVATLTQEISTVRGEFEATAANITTTLTDHSRTIAQHLQLTGTEVNEAILAKSAEVNNIFKQTGDSLIIDIGLRGSEVTQKLDETGSRIAEYITDKGNTLADKIAETGDRLYETVNVHGVDLDKRLGETGAKIVDALSLRTQEAEKAINDVGSQVVDKLSLRASDVQEALHSASDQVSATLTLQSSQFKSELETLSTAIIDNVKANTSNVHASLLEAREQVVNTFTLNSAQFKTDVDSLGANLNSSFANVEKTITINGVTLTKNLGDRVEELSSMMGKHISGYEALAANVGMDLSLKLTENTAALNDKFQSAITEFDIKISDKTNEISTAHDQRLQLVNEALDSRAKTLNENLANRTLELAKTIDESGATFATTLEQRAGEVSSSLTNHTQTLANLFDENGNAFLTSLKEKGESINSSVTAAHNEIIQTLDTRGGAIAEVLSVRANEITKSFSDSGLDLIKTLNETTDNSTNALTSTHEKLTGAVSDVLSRLGTSNDTLRTLATNAQYNLSLIDEQLGKRMGELDAVVNNVAATAESSAGHLEKHVTALKDVSTNTLESISGLAAKMGEHTQDLTKLSSNFETAQSDFTHYVETRRAALDEVVNHLAERSLGLDNLLKLAQEKSNEIFTFTAENSKNLVRVLTETSNEQGLALSAQVENLKIASNQERQTTQAQMQVAYDATQNNINALYADSAAKFGELTNSLHIVSAEIQRELESTRAELKRGLIDLPRETQDHAASMRQVVADQIKALAELNEIVSKSGRSFDVVEPKNSLRPESRVVEDAPQPRPAPEPRRETYTPAIPQRAVEPAKAPTPQREGWLSDLLARASKDEPAQNAPMRSIEPAFSKNADPLETLSTEIGKYIDTRTAGDVWERYRRGERNVFTNKLYSAQGLKAFDDIKRRYRRDDDFRYSVDLYIDEFERILSNANRETRDPNATLTMLVSDTGKAYTLLAHAAGRFE